jgi:SnoaL-like domain
MPLGTPAELRFASMDEDNWGRNVAEISALVYGYSDRIDSGDLEGLADLLADAGFGAGTGPLLSGRDQVLDLYKKTVRIYDNGTPLTKHLVTNLVVEVDDAMLAASSRSYFTVMQAAPGKPLGPIVSGRYNDKFAKVDGSWRFSERRITTDLVGDVSAHMLPRAAHLLTEDR